MVELLRLLPVGHVMAALAVRSELAFVGVGVACGAVLRKSEIRPSEIRLLNQRPVGRNHMRRRVAFLADDRGVFFHQRISRQLVVELLE